MRLVPLLAAVPTLALITACHAPMPTITDRSELARVAQSQLDKVVERRDAPGISYTVVTAGDVVFDGQAGVRDAATDEPVTPSTIFMACSTTKAITAVAVMRLAELGEMELDAPLSIYVHHPYGDGVTVAMALAHTGGIPAPAPLDWFFVDGEVLDHRGALDRVLADNPEPADEPGAEYRYSNLGYWLIGRAVENVTGESYADAVQRLVFDPLHIAPQDATFQIPGDALATGHSRKWSPTNALFYSIAPSRYWAESSDGWSRFERLIHFGAAYGGLYATTGALAKVLQDLLREDSLLLSPSSKATMFAPRKTTSGDDVGGGLGWVIGEVNGHAFYGKQGGAIGFHGNVRIYPELGLGTVFLANSTRVSQGPIDELSDELDGPILDYWSTR